MASKPDEIHQQIEAQRQLVSQRILDLQEHLNRDVRYAKQQVTRPVDAVKSTVEQQVEERPMLAMAGAFAAGVAIGAATGPGGKREADARSEASGSGGLFALAGARIVEPLVDALSQEARPFVRDLVAKFRSRRPASEPLEGPSPDQPPWDKETRRAA